MTSRSLPAAFSALLVALSLASATHGGIVPVSRVSTAALEATVEEESFNDTRTGDQFGVFDDGLSYEAGDLAGTHARGSISQDSRVELTPSGRLTGSGILDAQAFAQFLPGDTGGPLQIFGDTGLTVLFRIVDAPEQFLAQGTFLGGGPRGATGRINLQEISDPDAIVTIFGDNNAMGQAFDRDVMLQPGLYRLYASVGVGSSGSSPGDPFSAGEEARLDFNFGVGGKPAAIPLPAAAWSGILTLPVLAAAIRRARRGRD